MDPVKITIFQGEVYGRLSGPHGGARFHYYLVPWSVKIAFLATHDFIQDYNLGEVKEISLSRLHEGFYELANYTTNRLGPININKKRYI